MASPIKLPSRPTSSLDMADFEVTFGTDNENDEAGQAINPRGTTSTGLITHTSHMEVEDDDITHLLYSDEVQDSDEDQAEEQAYNVVHASPISTDELTETGRLDSLEEWLLKQLSSSPSRSHTNLDDDNREGSDWDRLSAFASEDVQDDDGGSGSDDYSEIVSSEWGTFEDIAAESGRQNVSLDNAQLHSSPRSTLFMETTPRSPEWVSENLEAIAAMFLRDLALGRAPRVDIASRTSVGSIVYDEENGVIRRRQDFALVPAEREKMEALAMSVSNTGTEDEGEFLEHELMTRVMSRKSLEEKGLISGMKSFTRTYYYGRHLSQSVTSIMSAVDLIHENVCRSTISSKRDLYYRDVMQFGSQPAIDNIVEDLACTLKVPRSCLNVVAGRRSVVYGSIRMVMKVRGKQTTKSLQTPEEQDSKAWSSKVPLASEAEISSTAEFEQDDSLDKTSWQTNYNTLMTIPVTTDDVLEIEIHPRTRFILVIEKEATMEHLISTGFCDTHGPCILMTSKGYPDRVARQLLKLLSDMIRSGQHKHFLSSCSEDFIRGDIMSTPSHLPSRLSTRASLNIPLLALVDCDPHGIEIYLTYRCGSIRSAYDNANLAVPNLKCLGQVPRDWNMYRSAERLWDKFERNLIPLTETDRAKLLKLLTKHPYVQRHTEWKRQISRMLMMNRKSELQSLCVGEIEVPDEKQNKGNSHALVQYLERNLQTPHLLL